nr:RecName: Full=Dextranase; AltName: Full=Alpha-1,6-glucan-6-glucanohydrolase [Bacillus licheniformis]
AYTVTLYLQG